MSQPAGHRRRRVHPAQVPRSAASQSTRWPCALIVLVGVVAYSNSFAGRFILDDSQAIQSNSRIRGFWPLSRFLTDTRPVVDFTLAVNYALGEVDVAGYHVVNLLIHLLAAATLYGVVRRTLLLPRMAERFTSRASWIALSIALIWEVHPLCTQAVTYVIQRAESMMALFYLFTLYCVMRGASSDRAFRWNVAAVIACALGMGTKAVMASAPVVVLLFDVVFLTGSWRETIRRRGGLHATLFATESILFVLGVIPGLFVTQQRDPITVGFGMVGVSAWEYARTQPGIILHYLRLCIWPHPLCVDYGWPVAKTIWEVLPGAVVVFAVAGVSAYLLWRKRPMGFPGAALVLILLPTSSIVPIRDLAFEHRMYLPLAAVVAAMVLAGDFLLTGGLRGKPSVIRRPAWLGVGLVSIVVVASAKATFARNAMYADPILLWRQNIAMTPDHARPHNALGWAYFAAGRHAEALASYRRALEIDPNLAGAYAAIGELCWKERRVEEAVENYNQALRISPFEFNAEFHSRLGSALMALGRVDDAVKALEDSIYIDSNLEAAHYNLGNAHRIRGRLDAAISEYREALRVDPRSTRSAVNLGLALSSSNRDPEAIGVLQDGVRALSPESDPDAAFKLYFNLGGAMLRQGRRSEAREALQEAVRRNPSHAGAQAALRQAGGG